MSAPDTGARANWRTPRVMALARFCNEVGISATTAWRWRADGWIECVALGGKQYVLLGSVDRLIQRAKSGELASESCLPNDRLVQCRRHAEEERQARRKTKRGGKATTATTAAGGDR
jgi:hypothetical protein